jgi:hypothetical protein
LAGFERIYAASKDGNSPCLGFGLDRVKKNGKLIHFVGSLFLKEERIFSLFRFRP